jgi:uncharacterized RDD family membrane protein YckC
MSAGEAVRPGHDTVRRQGTYAGAISRLAAFVVDIFVSWGLFTLAVDLLSVATQLLANEKVTLRHHQLLAFIFLVVWEFLYFSYSWAVAGKTVGMALLGIQVMTRQGDRISHRQAFIRTLTLPLGFLTLGIGFLGILYQRERRAIQDLCAGTCVVYSWDARAARWRFMSRTDIPKVGETQAAVLPETGPAPAPVPAPEAAPSTQ